jgi:transcriptional regulator with XRE-family HTH domain
MRRQWVDLGEALRALRRARDLGQKEVISRAGEDVGERTLRAYENGEQRPSRDRLIRLLTNSYGLKNEAEVGQLLQMAGYLPLTGEEQRQFCPTPSANSGFAITDGTSTPESDAPAKTYLKKIRDDWGARTETALRRLFWETLDDCFMKHCLGQADYPATLQDLVDSAHPLPKLPLPDGEHLRDYAAKCLETLRGSDLLLHQFCNLVYPAKDPAQSLKGCSRLDPQAFDEFHMHARWRFTRFWTAVGEAVYVERLVDLSTVMRELLGSGRIIQMLAYLEVSLIRWTREAGMGARGLFLLNRDWDIDK